MFNYHKGRHSVYSLTVHLVFVCKRRGKVFEGKHLEYLKMVFDGVLDEFESELLVNESLCLLSSTFFTAALMHSQINTGSAGSTSIQDEN